MLEKITKIIAGRYDRKRIEEFLFDTEISVKMATGYLKEIEYLLKIKNNTEKIDLLEKEKRKEYEEFRAKYLEADKIPETQLSQAEIKIKKDFELKMVNTLSKISEIEKYRMRSGNISEYGSYVSQYLTAREKITEYEKDKDKIRKTVDRSPYIKAKMLSIEAKLVEMKKLEDQIFSHNQMLLLLLPEEYQKKFRKNSLE